MVVRSILSNWVAMVTTAVVTFLLTPILIHHLGPLYYGMWILVASVTDYYGILDMGLRTTLQRFVAGLKGNNERLDLNRVFATALVLSLGISLLITVSAVAVAGVLPRFFQLRAAGEQHLFTQLVVLLGISLGLTFQARILGSYLCGLQRFDLYNAAAVLTSVVRAILLGGAVELGFGVLACGILNLAVASLSLLVHWRMLFFADRDLDVKLRLFAWSTMRQMVSYSFYAFMSVVGGYLRFYTDSIVIGRLLSVALITPFDVAGRLMNSYSSVLFAVTNPLLSRMSELDRQGKEVELQELFLQSTRLTSLLGLFLGFLLFFDGKMLIRLWVGERYVSSYTLLLVLLSGYVLSQMQSPSVMLIFARNRHRLQGWWTFGEGIVNLVLSVYWARKYGLLGVALGTAVPMLFVKILFQPWYALRTIRLPWSRYLRESFARPVFAGAIFWSLEWFVQRSGTYRGALDFIFLVGWQTVLFGFLAFFIGFEPSDRDRLNHEYKRLKGLLRRWRKAGSLADETGLPEASDAFRQDGWSMDRPPRGEAEVGSTRK